ncbi:Mitogen-activated protein kinase kinase kinase [Parasponia andersonii]|uniref:RING-type E3 ubiquitin transferase n=1 Tax=Parasponia andersonii TaxID=3476 RepID=A0A2P5ASA8_PARAD|nr:Mitogen-activated protein kinase kinase kinase [Parasponia andersonii]
MNEGGESDVPAAMTSVAVAVHGGSGGIGGNGSRRAVRWAVENLMDRAERFVLVHVMPKISSIPTPSGDWIPVAEIDAGMVTMYVEEIKEKVQEIFIPFKKLCNSRKMETLILEGDDPAWALLKYMSESGISCLVMGSCSSNFLTRKLKGPGIPTSVLSYTANPCDIYVVSKKRIITKAANSSHSGDASSAQQVSTQRDNREGFRGFDEPVSGLDSFSAESRERNHQNLEYGIGTLSLRECNSVASLDADKLDSQAEVEQLRQELQNTIEMYKRACEELVHAQKKVQLVSSVCLEETRRVNTALEREESLKRIAAEEKAKHLEAIKEVERARVLLAKEAYERQIAEVNALEESSEKRKLVEALFSSDKRYRRYTWNEIEIATDFFSETNVIGEGGYGKVYKCSLDHTPVAVKVLQNGADEKKHEFLKEVEVLSQLHHPNIVLLLGACPERGCLVYQYMEHGSLEDYIYRGNGKSQLPWFIRFRIAFEIACGLAFLHNAKPEPIVHRDLKPGNILLDSNYVSKIGDIGLAKIISEVVPDSITEYRDSVLAGTLFYMDPEYQRTGTIRPKSDLYAFGIIILQLLTSRHPNGLILTVENAMRNGSFVDILDKSVTDWPLVETEELARIALKCSNLRCRDRPDLDAEVLPALKKLVDIANTSAEAERDNIHAPSHYYCPILQEIMDDPYIAADGFTYEHRAIKAWLEKHNVSPSTKQKFQHSMLTPDHTLRSAINDWRSRVTFAGI